MELFDDYNRLLKETMSYIAMRFTARPAYPWLDTKFDILTGTDCDTNDLIKGLNTVYAWIQGRGLEALVGHILWFEKYENSQEFSELIIQLKATAKCLFKSLYNSKELNCGHLYFFLDHAGRAKNINIHSDSCEYVKLDDNTPYNFSDLFCSKGMYLASKYFEYDEIAQQLKQYCHNICKAALEGTFKTDQQQLDPKNLVMPVENRFSHGPAMISIGVACLLAEYEQDVESVEIGLELIESVLNNYSTAYNPYSRVAAAYEL